MTKIVGPRQDECRGWDVNEIVFSPAMWPVYHSLMRADFTLFDEYDHKHAGMQTFGCHCVFEQHQLFLRGTTALQITPITTGSQL